MNDQVEIMMTMFADYLGTNIKEARAYAAGFMDGVKMTPTLPAENGETEDTAVDTLAQEVRALIVALTVQREKSESRDRELNVTTQPLVKQYWEGVKETQGTIIDMLEAMMKRYDRG